MEPYVKIITFSLLYFFLGGLIGALIGILTESLLKYPGKKDEANVDSAKALFTIKWILFSGFFMAGFYALDALSSLR